MMSIWDSLLRLDCLAVLELTQYAEPSSALETLQLRQLYGAAPETRDNQPSLSMCLYEQLYLENYTS